MTMPTRKPVNLKKRVLLTATLVTALGLAAAHYVRAASQPGWIALQSNDWARFEIEPALYEQPGHKRYFNHFRVVNKSQHALAMNLEDAGVGWPNLAASDRTTLGEGDRRSIVSELVAFPLVEDVKRKERSLIVALRAGKASLIPSEGTLDYFIAAQIGTRSGLDRELSSIPLWVRSKTFWPGAPTPLHLILVLRGAVSTSDGVKAKTLLVSRELGLKLPLKWKMMPANARIMKNP